MKKTILALCALSLALIPSVAKADWKGDLVIELTGAKAPPDGGGSDGKIFAHGKHVRFELSRQGRNMVILVDAKENSAAMLMPQQKMYMQMPPGMRDKSQVACSTEGVDECLKARGFKKTGTDTVDGHPCVVYELADTTSPKKSKHTLWRPTDMKEVFMIKSLFKTDDRSVMTLVKNVQVGSLDSSLFTVPTDYKKMQMPDFGALRH